MQNARNRGGPDTMWATGHEIAWSGRPPTRECVQRHSAAQSRQRNSLSHT
jgi:hypothetical protein